MKKAFGFIGILLLGLAFGIAFGFWKIKNHSKEMPHNGPWTYTLEAGSQDESLLNRAAIARSGLFALPKSEVLYYMARQDTDGNELDASHVYEVQGQSPKARYWSICLYDQDMFLTKNEINRFAFNLKTAQPDSLGKFSFKVAAKAQTGKWLPTGASKNFVLCLRIYNPDKLVFEHPDITPLPNIKRID